MREKEKIKGVTVFKELETAGVSRWGYSFASLSFELVEGTQSVWYDRIKS
jgi:hypothetical protein